MSFLVFQLKAPLASFGQNLGESKLTDTRPRKSAVLGLVAAALGIERSQTDTFAELFRVLRMAVVELKAPTLLSEFQTVQAPLKSIGRTRREQLTTGEGATALVPRQYLQDGHWLVALEGSAAHLSAIAAALAEPWFPLFLGRKSCPLSVYTAPLVVDADTVEAALHTWVTTTGTRVPADAPMAWEPGMACEAVASREIAKTDVRTSLMNQFFQPRRECEGRATLIPA